MDGARVARAAMARAMGSGHRRARQIGVVSRQMNRAARNHVRYRGSSRLIERSGSLSLHRVKKVYATSKTMYGTATPVIRRLIFPGLQSKLREK
ncbi:hypothetical protein SHIRM173S_03933 [Streptomyces hirsutus]